MDRNKLTKKQRWAVADLLAQDRLPLINERLNDVVPADNFYTRYGKRVIDIFFSFIAIVVTLPINLLLAFITLFDLGLPLFFVQNRVGKNGQLFKIVKFRNMRIAYDEKGEPLSPDCRVTKVGKFLRTTSLDELLNFWSVLKGDMSLIGPRPLVPEYTTRYNKRHRGRLLVKPGLECPPRDISRGVRTWQEQFENDIWYVEHLSLKTDVLMLFNLARFAFDRKNAEARSTAKRGTFMGYDMDGCAINFDQVPQEYIDRLVGGQDD